MTVAGGQLPGPELCPGTCVSGLWCMLAAPGSKGRSAAPPGPAVVVFTPGPSFLSQPPHFSITSTCSTAPSPNSAQGRPARRWPCATRESLPGCGPAPAPSHGAPTGSPQQGPPVPVGQAHRRQGPARGGARWCGSCLGHGVPEAGQRLVAELLGAGGWFPKTAEDYEASGASLPHLVVQMKEGFSRELLLCVEGVRKGTARDWVKEGTRCLLCWLVLWGWDAFSVFSGPGCCSFYSGSLCTFVFSVAGYPEGAWRHPTGFAAAPHWMWVGEPLHSPGLPLAFDTRREGRWLQTGGQVCRGSAWGSCD